MLFLAILGSTNKVWFYGTSTVVGYLMPNPLYTYIQYTGFGLVWFYGTSTVVGYLKPNPLYMYISNIYITSKHIL